MKYSNVNTKMRTSKLIIKINTQKQMATYGFGHKFHDLNYFEFYFFLIFLEFLTHLRSSSNNLMEIH